MMRLEAVFGSSVAETVDEIERQAPMLGTSKWAINAYYQLLGIRELLQRMGFDKRELARLNGALFRVRDMETEFAKKENGAVA